MKITVDLQIETLANGEKRAAVHYLLSNGISLPPTQGLPGATEDQAVFNLFRGKTPQDDFGQAFTFLLKALPALAPPAKPMTAKES